MASISEPAPALSATLEFFYDGNCGDCRSVRDGVLADARMVLPELAVVEYDTRTDVGLRRLLAAQQALGVNDTHPVAAVLNGRLYLGGRHVIERDLFASLAALLDRPDENTAAPAAGATVPDGDDQVWRRAQGWGIGMIMLAGVVDGLNPCAFTAIILLASLLLRRGWRAGVWWLYGIMFCAGVFSAYLLLGFGVLRVLMQLPGWRLAGDVLRWAVAAVLLLLAAGSLRDALVFRRTGRPDRLLLRLPARLSGAVHQLMRWGAAGRPGMPAGALGMLAAGVLVTLLEAPCTGQIYGPVLFYLSRRPDMETLGLLVVYNLMFVLPHALVFVLAGSRRAMGFDLAAWSRRHVVPAKLLMALLMLLLAFMILI